MRREIQKFAGALKEQPARKGMYITTSPFSREAEGYAATIQTKIALINGQRLVQLMADHGMRVSRTTEYEIRRLDTDCLTKD